MSKLISVIVPCFNELDTIEIIINKILSLKLNLQIILVDDGSTDGTSNLIKKKIEKKIDKVIYLKKNSGKGFAIATAQKYVEGEIVIIQDADLEYDPNDYYKLIDPISKKKTFVVYGSRFLNNTNGFKKNYFFSSIRVWGNKILTAISNILNKQNLSDAHTCYKVFDSEVFKKIYLQEKGFAFCPEITTKISKMNFKIIEVPIFYDGRKYVDGKKIKTIDFFYAIKALIKYRFFIKLK